MTLQHVNCAVVRKSLTQGIALNQVEQHLDLLQNRERWRNTVQANPAMTTIIAVLAGQVRCALRRRDTDPVR